MTALRHHDHHEDDSGVEFIELTPEEGMALFDREARRLVGMSGEEFLLRWDAGEFRPVPDETEADRRLASLVMALPFAGRSIA